MTKPVFPKSTSPSQKCDKTAQNCLHTGIKAKNHGFVTFLVKPMDRKKILLCQPLSNSYGKWLTKPFFPKVTSPSRKRDKTAKNCLHTSMKAENHCFVTFSAKLVDRSKIWPHQPLSTSYGKWLMKPIFPKVTPPSLKHDKTAKNCLLTRTVAKNHSFVTFSVKPMDRSKIRLRHLLSTS